MSHAGYQGGPSFEVFSAQGSRPLPSLAKLTNAKCIRREFDRSVRGNVVVVEGDTTQTKLQLLRDGKPTLGLTQPWLVLQLFAREGQPLYFEFLLADAAATKRRMIFSASVKEVVRDPLHVKFPLCGVEREVWLNYCFDLPGLFAASFGPAMYKCVDGILIGPSCRLRKVFTLRQPPSDALPLEEVQPGLAFPPGVEYSTACFVPPEDGPYAAEAPVPGPHSPPSAKVPLAFGTRYPAEAPTEPVRPPSSRGRPTTATTPAPASAAPLSPPTTALRPLNGVPGPGKPLRPGTPRTPKLPNAPAPTGLRKHLAKPTPPTADRSPAAPPPPPDPLPASPPPVSVGAAAGPPTPASADLWQQRSSEEPTPAGAPEPAPPKPPPVREYRPADYEAPEPFPGQSPSPPTGLRHLDSLHAVHQQHQAMMARILQGAAPAPGAAWPITSAVSPTHDSGGGASEWLPPSLSVARKDAEGGVSGGPTPVKEPEERFQWSPARGPGLAAAAAREDPQSSVRPLHWIACTRAADASPQPPPPVARGSLEYSADSADEEE
eukprot:EG_transcript_8496